MEKEKERPFLFTPRSKRARAYWDRRLGASPVAWYRGDAPNLGPAPKQYDPHGTEPPLTPFRDPNIPEWAYDRPKPRKPKKKEG